MNPVDTKGIQYDYCESLTRATIDDYVHLFREVYPESEKLSRRYLEWLYCENPEGGVVGVDAYLEGRLAAHYATVPRRYSFKNHEMSGLLSVNTATHPNHRGKGLFKLTASKTYHMAADRGFKFVVGVANDQSIHAFQTSLGFESLGQVRLHVSSHDALEQGRDKLRLMIDGDWLAWRASAPTGEYWLSEFRGKFFLNTLKGKMRIVLGSVPKESVLLSRLEVRKSSSPLFLSPAFPARSGSLKVPKKVVPSPWHVIFKNLDSEVDVAEMASAVSVDGIAMDSF